MSRERYNNITKFKNRYNTVLYDCNYMFDCSDKSIFEINYYGHGTIHIIYDLINTCKYNLKELKNKQFISNIDFSEEHDNTETNDNEFI
jgi:hypothetical protein